MGRERRQRTLNEPFPDPRKVARPLLLMTGVRDAMVPYALTARFFTDIPASAPEHYQLTVQQAGHEFHNACLDGFVTTGCATSMPHRELQALANRVGAAFLLRHVAGRSITESELGVDDARTSYAVVKAPHDGPVAAPTAQPIETAGSAPAAPAGTVLLADDLTSAQTGTLPSNSRDPARYTASYVAGMYEIAVRRPGTQGEAPVPGTFADATIAVDVEMADPIPGRFAQLACRSQNATSQYRFTFQPATGQVLLVRWLPVANLGVPRVSMVPLDLTSTAIHKDSVKNRAELRCRGTRITARVNGVDVLSVSDNTFAAGQFWIAAGVVVGATSTPAGPTARFSNLVITQE